MKSLPFDQSVLQEIASPFLEYPSDPCVQTVGRSQVFFLHCVMSLCIPDEQIFKKNISNFLLLNLFFCLLSVCKPLYNKFITFY